MRRFLVALLFALGLPLAAHAQFYVCASNCFSPNGSAVTPSDSNNGTSPSTPFLTIGKAQTSMQGSGTKKTYIEAGTYTLGTATFTGSGNWVLTSSDNGETWASYNGGAAIISGGGSPAVTNFIVDVQSGTTGITFEGLTFQNLGGMNSTHSAANGDGGVSFTGSLGTTANHVFKYNTCVTPTDACVTMSGINTALIDSNHCENVVSASAQWGSCFIVPSGLAGGVFITVSHNLCENTYYGCVDINGTSGSTVLHDVTIDSNVVVNPCLQITGLGVNDCGALYFGDRNISSTNMKITNNVIMGSNLDILDSNTMTSKGIYLDDCASGFTISGNLMFNNVALFPLFYHGGNNNHVTNNVIVLASGGSSGAEIAGYQSGVGTSGGVCNASGGTMSGNTFQNNVVWFQGNWPGSGPWETLSTSPTNGPTISGNQYYMQTGVSFRNTSGAYKDSSPVVCGPSMGASPLGNISPQQLWTMLANGVISSWQQIATNQGPTLRTCSAGQY